MLMWDTQRDTQINGRNLMKYVVEMGSDAMMYIPSFTKIGSGIQRLIAGIHRQYGVLISLLLFFQKMQSGLTKTDDQFFIKLNRKCITTQKYALSFHHCC
jgi:hypothetical protein